MTPVSTRSPSARTAPSHEDGASSAIGLPRLGHQPFQTRTHYPRRERLHPIIIPLAEPDDARWPLRVVPKEPRPAVDRRMAQGRQPMRRIAFFPKQRASPAFAERDHTPPQPEWSVVSGQWSVNAKILSRIIVEIITLLSQMTARSSPSDHCPHRLPAHDAIHRNTVYRSAERTMQTGSVSIQARPILRTVAHWRPEPLAAIVPATPEERTCVVLTGRPP